MMGAVEREFPLHFRMSTQKIILGDCLDVLPSLADASVDMILTDPPYGNTEKGSFWQRRDAVLGWKDGNGVYKNENSHSELLTNDGKEADRIFKKALVEWVRVLSPGGNLCCCCGGGGGDNMQFAKWALWMSKVLKFKQAVVWDKGGIGTGWHYRRSYEMVMVATKRGASCKWYDETGIVENVIRPGDYGIKKVVPKKGDHVVPKHVNLAVHFIKLHTQEGDTVLDSFMGRGWVGVACKRLNRNFIGIEIDPKWHTAAEKRIQKFRKGFFSM